MHTTPRVYSDKRLQKISAQPKCMPGPHLAHGPVHEAVGPKAAFAVQRTAAAIGHTWATRVLHEPIKCFEGAGHARDSIKHRRQAAPRSTCSHRMAHCTAAMQPAPMQQCSTCVMCDVWGTCTHMAALHLHLHLAGQ